MNKKDGIEVGACAHGKTALLNGQDGIRVRASATLVFYWILKPQTEK